MGTQDHPAALAADRLTAVCLLITLTIAGSLGVTAAASADCTPSFDLSMSDPGPPGTVYALASFDDGTGLAIYAGGQFAYNGARGHVVRWNEYEWEELGNGVVSGVRALGVFDAGDGPALYAGSINPAGLSRWTGTEWEMVAPASGGAVLDMLVWDDGSGPALYVTGGFSSIGGMTTNRIAKWTGSVWSTLGGGLTGIVGGFGETLEIFDDGSGEALYVGGRFTGAGGNPANRLARWRDGAWFAIPGGDFNADVKALRVWQANDTTRLIVGGNFDQRAGTDVRLAGWDGTVWSTLADGFNGSILDLVTIDGGPFRSFLYVGGSFSHIGGVQSRGIAYLDGGAGVWHAIAYGLNSNPWALAVHEDDQGRSVLAGGAFTYLQPPAGQPASIVARHVVALTVCPAPPCTDPDWHALDHGLVPPGARQEWNSARAITQAHDGSLIVGGSFQYDLPGDPEPTPVSFIARWDGDNWHPLGDGLNDRVRALITMPNGDIIAGGQFTHSGAVALDGIARWDGAAWHPVGGGMDGPTSATVRALHLTGSGDLLVAGEFMSAGGVAAPKLARWDGHQWHALGTDAIGDTVPTSGGGETTAWLSQIAVHPDGTIFIGGYFQIAGELTHLAHRVGSSWQKVPGFSGVLYHFQMLPGGDLVVQHSPDIEQLRRWTGSQWHDFGPPLVFHEPYEHSRILWSSAVFSDGSLVVGATPDIVHQPGDPDHHNFEFPLFRLAGDEWIPLLPEEIGASLRIVNALVQLASGEVVIGGQFTLADADYHCIMRLGCPAESSGPTSVADGADTGRTPTALARGLASPNPFNPRTTIAFDLPRATEATLSVHDLRGRVVRTLVNGRLAAGRQLVEWDGRDAAGRPAASGVYLVRLAASDGQAWALKVTLAK
jgi:hypothetical protein